MFDSIDYEIVGAAVGLGALLAFNRSTGANRPYCFGETEPKSRVKAAVGEIASPNINTKSQPWPELKNKIKEHMIKKMKAMDGARLFCEFTDDDGLGVSGI